MKVLVVGCRGMLGQDLMLELEKNRTLKYASLNLIGVDLKELEVTDLSDTVAYITTVKPDFVINCAAYTDVDGCERNIDLAYRVNGIAPRNLAVACNHINATLVHISTDYVFDGKKGTSYLEMDRVNPLNIYGKSKLEGEHYVQSLTNRYYIVRTQYLYGVSGNNFVKTMLSLAKERRNLKVIDDQFGCPTYTKDLSQAIAKLILEPAYGIYHITNSGIASWYEFAMEIFKFAKIDNITVEPCTTQAFPKPAQRPAYSPLQNYFWELNGYKPLRDFREALNHYFAESNH